MKKFIGLLLLVLLLAVSCQKKDASDEFSNSLKLGTGLNPSNLFQLTGEGTSFTKLTPVYFRLESKDDMAGSMVRLHIVGSSVAYDENWDFNNPQSYGHIFLSSFTLTEAGTYTVTGILVASSKTVASVTFTIQ